jgi:hypothetical protein
MDNIIQQSAPAPGVAIPGDLYVDLQSKQLWLGVDTSVDATGSVLVSDIMAIQPAIDTSTATAKSYTDTQVATRAPTVHTHTASQITDFTNAVVNVISTQPGVKAWTRYMISMYSGSQANIGVGNLVGWALCDGTIYTVNSVQVATPDLRDRFILGAGNKPNNSTNVTTGLVTGAAGAHTPVVQGTALSIAQMPSHGHTATIAGSGTGGTNNAGAHAHSPLNGGGFTTYFGNGTNMGSSGGGSGLQQGGSTDSQGTHSHTVSVNVTVSGGTDAAGSGSAHTHTATAVPDHTHSVTLQNFRESIPYFALAFIMYINP